MCGFPEGERDTARSREEQHRANAAEIVTFRLNINIALARLWLFERREKKT